MAPFGLVYTKDVKDVAYALGVLEGGLMVSWKQRMRAVRRRGYR